MAQQYVRFMRGNTQAFNLLTTKDKDTLYFIYDNDTEGMLYLGDRLIAGGDIGSTSIDELKDVLISAGITDGSILVYEQGQWVNKPLDEVVPVFVGPSSGSTGVPGLVPAPPQDSPNLFLRSDGTWAVIEVGDKLVINEKVFVQGEDGTLDLLGFSDAEPGAQLQKGADGKLSWVVPDTETVAGLSSAVAGLREDVTDLVTDLNTLSGNVYTKEETLAEIAKAEHLKRKIVSSLTEAQEYMSTHDDAEQYIFMVPSDNSLNGDKYDEYLVITVGDNLRSLEKVGSWEVDLSGYATTAQLENKVDKDENARLITNDEAAKLEALLAIKSINDTLELNADGQLGVKSIAISQVTDLSRQLQAKANADVVATLAADVADMKGRLVWEELTTN
jgi:hypothetical protein